MGCLEESRLEEKLPAWLNVSAVDFTAGSKART